MRTVAVIIATLLTALWPYAVPRAATAPSTTFKIATWNIRSGMGIAGFGSRTWNHTTLNCTDRRKPMNAWGIGLPQKELQRLKADPSIVVLAVQEAWNCGSPEQLNAVLGFKAATREQNGVALIARYGFAGKQTFHRIGAEYDSWLVGGAVCLNIDCSAAVPMFSTHWGGSDAEWPKQAQNVIDVLSAQAQPHVFMGDLNVFKIDRWNPQAPCTNPDKPGRSRAIALVEGAGYVDAWKATQDGEGWTGMASRRGCGSPEGNLFKRIDYVYVKQLRVVQTTMFARAAPGTDSPSDHAGLIAELALPSSPTR